MKKKLLALFLSVTCIFQISICVQAYDGSEKSFDVVAEVFDYGESVTGLIIDMKEEVSSDDLNEDKFSVTANNLKQNGDEYYSGQCNITDVKVVNEKDIHAKSVEKGQYIVIDLEYGFNNIASNSIYYNIVISPEGEFDFFKSFNLEVDLHYTITQTDDIGTISKDSVYKQNKIIRPLVDKFTKKTSEKGLQYREYVPTIKAESHPLIVWFHGSGEGGENNSAQILANKGGTAWISDEAQNIFNGAYVIAPQCPDNWAVGSKDYVPDALALIEETLKNHPDIDSNRILIAGCSAGASMTWLTFLAKPEIFAAVIPIAGPEIEKEQLAKVVDTPIWMIHSENDTTVPYEYSLNNYNNLKELNGNVYLSTYKTVNVNGTEYDGHWSWIYALNNDPKREDGTSLFSWMSKQTLQPVDTPSIDKETNTSETIQPNKMTTSVKTGDETHIYLIMTSLTFSFTGYIYLKRKEWAK